MTLEDKELLLKDLCTRLPYGVKVQGNFKWGFDGQIMDDIRESVLDIETLEWFMNGIEVRPYLRPLSSMTEEEENEWHGLNIDPLFEAVGEQHTRIEDLMLRAKSQYNPVDWLNAHHFDYRGLIERGLAIEAPINMYKI